MLKVYYSNRMDALVEPLADRIRERNARDPLETFSIVVPNRATGAWLKLAIAQEVGVASNLEFPFLNSHLQQLAERATVDDRPIGILTRERFALLFFHELSSIHAQSAPELAEPNRWIDHAPTEASRTARRWEMARKLGDIFHEYAFNRSELLRDWAKRQPTSNSNWLETRNWQHALWRRVVTSGDRAFGWTLSADAQQSLGGHGASADALERTWTSLPEVIRPAMARVGDGADTALRELHIFATNQPGTTLLRELRTLAEHVEVHFYVLNPCTEFWEDIRDTSLSKLIAEDRLPSASELTGMHRDEDLEIASESDPYGLFDENDPELLRLWGRTGREFIMLLTQLTEGDFEGRFRAPRIPTAGTLLEKVQQDVLLRAEQPIVESAIEEPKESQLEETARSITGDASSGDAESIRFFAAPTVLRELEYVAEDIEARLAADDTLNPTDIAVMIAGEFDPYFALSERAFATFGMFPVEYLDAPLSSRSRVSVAAQKVFELLKSDFKRHEVVSTLGEILSVQGRKDQLERWELWIDETGVVFGLDARDIENTYLDPTRYHWDQGLSRVALGSFIDEQQSWTPASGEAPIRATSRAGDELHQAAELTTYVRALMGDQRFARGAYALREWVEAFVRMLRFYIRPVEPVDERSLERVIQAVQKLAESDPVEGKVPASVALSMTLDAVRGVQARSAVRMIEGVRFGPVDQLGGIPHRHTYVLGLNDGEFPQRELMSTLDLRREKRRKGDVRREERDRYRFLNVVMNTGESLTCSYHAIDPVSGEAMEPSSVVHELQHALLSQVSAEHIKSTLTTNVSSDSVPRDEASASRSASGIRTSELAKNLREEWRSELKKASSSADTDYALPQNFLETQFVLPAPTLSELRQITRMPYVPQTTDRPVDQEIDIRAVSRFFDRPTETIIAQRMGFSTGVWLDDSNAEETEPFSIDDRDMESIIQRVLISSDPSEAQADLVALAVSELELAGLLPSPPFRETAIVQIAARIGEWLSGADALSSAGLLGGASVLNQFSSVCVGSGRAEVDYSVVHRPLRIVLGQADGNESADRVRLTGHVDAIADNGSILTFTGKKLGKPRATNAVKQRDIRSLLLTWMLCRAAGISPAGSSIVFVSAELDEGTKDSMLQRHEIRPSSIGPDAIRAWFENYIKHTRQLTNYWISAKGMIEYSCDLFEEVESGKPSGEDLYELYLRAADAEIADRVEPSSYGQAGRGPTLSFEAHRLPPAPEAAVRELAEDLYLPLMTLLKSPIGDDQ